VINLQEGIGHGASVFINYYLLTYTKGLGMGQQYFSLYLLAYWSKCTLIYRGLYKLICTWCGLFRLPLALKHIHAAKHPCEYENLWSVPASEICVIKDWLYDLSDFN
jgi:hypothetical protein